MRWSSATRIERPATRTRATVGSPGMATLCASTLCGAAVCGAAVCAAALCAAALAATDTTARSDNTKSRKRRVAVELNMARHSPQARTIPSRGDGGGNRDPMIPLLTADRHQLGLGAQQEAPV